MNPPEPGGPSSQRSSRPFDAIVIALSSALLVIFGIVIGRFIVTTQAVAVVDRYDGELSSLRSEIVNLNRQLVQSQSRSTALEESAEQYRRLAQQHQIRYDTLAARQQSIRAMLASLSQRREFCLAQVEEYVALNQPVPARDVLRFAEAMFDAQNHAIDQLASSGASSSSLPSLPGFPPVATPASHSLPKLSAPTVQADLPKPDGAAPAGVFFAPPVRKKPAISSMYFPARREQQALTMPRRSGVTFHDTAAGESASVRR